MINEQYILYVMNIFYILYSLYVNQYFVRNKYILQVTVI